MGPAPDRRAPGVRVRPMRDDEADRVGELTLAAYDTYGHLAGPYRDTLGDPRSRGGCTALLVAECDAEVAGTVTFVLPGDEQWEGRPQPVGDAGFRMLAVDPAYEGLGVGRALVGECIARARDHGARRLVVTSMRWMTRAHRLYERLGFVRRHDLDVRFPSGVGWTLVLDLVTDADDHFPPPGTPPETPPWFEDVWRT
jgi:GNAT superfamily N-acetyltransferase